ncbi:MAG: ABC transporter permease [Nitrospinota bacterium]
MRGYALRRCLQSLVVLKGILVIVFLVLHVTGDPAMMLLPPDADEEAYRILRQQLGLDQPLVVQYGRFFWKVLQGDFGNSLVHEVPALPLVLAHLPATVELALAALLVALVIALPAGVIAAAKRDSPYDHASMGVALFGQSVPNFWMGLMLILFLSLYLDLFPTSGRGTLRHLALPALTAGLYATARITRLVRSGMLEVLNQDYIRTARSKGLAEGGVVMHHALKNASIPVVTLVGLELGILLGGTVVTETVFAWPGVGRLAVQSIHDSDYPVVEAVVFVLAFFFVFINLAVDLLYAYLDPRIRYE